MGDDSRPLVIDGGKSIVDFDNKAFKPIPQAGIDLAVSAMSCRRDVPLPTKDKKSNPLLQNSNEVFLQYMGVKHTVGTNSCGSAMYIALNVVGVEPGDKILTNAFTFHAVPSVIHHARAVPVLG